MKKIIEKDTYTQKEIEKNGIIYTPQEVIDFINNSVNEICKAEFGCELKDKGVDILEPFCGDGRFLVSVIQDVIGIENAKRKNKDGELHLGSRTHFFPLYFYTQITTTGMYKDE